MQVGEQHQIGPQKTKFLGLGFLDLDHQVGPPGLLTAHQPGTGGGEVSVADACPQAGPLLHPHLHAEGDQLADAVWGEGHPLFIAFDFGGDPNTGHGCRQLCCCHGARN